MPPGRRNKTAPAGLVPTGGMAGLSTPVAAAAVAMPAGTGAGAAVITKETESRDRDDDTMRLARWRAMTKRAITQVMLLHAVSDRGTTEPRAIPLHTLTCSAACNRCPCSHYEEKKYKKIIIMGKLYCVLPNIQSVCLSLTPSTSVFVHLFSPMLRCGSSSTNRIQHCSGQTRRAPYLTVRWMKGNTAAAVVVLSSCLSRSPQRRGV